MACYVHKLDIIKALVAAGANEKIVDVNGNSPLHIACEERSIQMVCCMVQCFKDEPEKLVTMMNIHNNYGMLWNFCFFWSL